MALTTVDSAVHWATNSSPCGPVHINCPFREPLENSPRKWMLNCLEGLDRWMSSTEPFTKYINLQDANVWNDIPSEIAEVSDLIRNTDKGLLVVGGVRTEDEMWAILLLARHLSWPVVADILSGLRLRKLSTSFPEIKDFLFVDHLDHALLSSFVRGWMHVDVVLQVYIYTLSPNLLAFLLPFHITRKGWKLKLMVLKMILRTNDFCIKT